MLRRRRDERGAILVQTAIALIGLMGFGSMCIDYGMLWVARGQAQNAADAGALAGAISLAFGDPNDQNRIRAVASAAGRANLVWSGAPVIDPVTDVTFPPCPPGAPGDPDLCVRVDAYRNQNRGNPLPTIFGPLIGVDAHGVRATATAQVAQGVTSTCVKPWGIPDKWLDRIDTTAPIDVNTWSLDDQFDRWVKQGSNYTMLSNPDEYVPPGIGSAGTGFTVPDDVGKRVQLKIGNPRDISLAAGNFLPIDLPLPTCENCPGGARYRANIGSCNGTTLQVGDLVWTEPGNMVGPTSQGIDDLIGDDDAYWVCAATGARAATTQDCLGYPSNPGSPRLVPVPAFNVQKFQESIALDSSKRAGKLELQITRLLGFFIEDMQGNDVVGRFAYYPSSGGISQGEIDESANFLRKVLLVR